MVSSAFDQALHSEPTQLFQKPSQWNNARVLIVYSGANALDFKPLPRLAYRWLAPEVSP